jgi:hypothetical protein
MLESDCCPRCKSDSDIRQIMYGLATYEDYKEAEKGKIVLGGCVIESGAPDCIYTIYSCV